MSKTVLFVASVTKKHIIQFHLPYMKWLQEHGYKVHVCAGDDFEPDEPKTVPYCDEYFILPFSFSFLLSVSYLVQFSFLLLSFVPLLSVSFLRVSSHILLVLRNHHRHHP